MSNISLSRNEVNEDIKMKLIEIEKYIDEVFPNKTKIKVIPDLRAIDEILSEDFKNRKATKISKRSIFGRPLKKPVFSPTRDTDKQPIKEKTKKEEMLEKREKKRFFKIEKKEKRINPAEMPFREVLQKDEDTTSKETVDQTEEKQTMTGDIKIQAENSTVTKTVKEIEKLEKEGGSAIKKLDIRKDSTKPDKSFFKPIEDSTQEKLDETVPLKLKESKKAEKEKSDKKLVKVFKKSRVRKALKREKESEDRTIKPLVDLSMKNFISELIQEEKEEGKKDLIDVEEKEERKELDIPSKEELVEHVLFDEDDPFFFDESVQLPSAKEEEEISKFSDDVELPRESLQFQPYVEFQSADEEINVPVESDEFEEVDFYPLYQPFAYVKILREKKTVDKIYALLEPELSEEEQDILNFLNDTLSSTAKLEIEKLEKMSAEKYLENELNQIISDYKLSISEETKQKIMYIMKRDLVGYGKIDALMRDPNIEDISCDGANIPVFVYHRKHGSLRTNINFKNEEELASFVIRLAQKCGKHISIAEPMLDATMPDGSRIQMTLSTEITTKGSTFTIRKFRAVPYSPIDLVKMNTLSPEMLAYLWILVENGASGIFAGGTASGKTTTLNAISLFIPREAKIVSIEETREINLPHPNWIPGVTRLGFGEVVADKVVGEIDMYDLMKAALRQRPEYIIVGEIRGREAYVLFQAMATGHTTYSTMHADSPQSLVHRLEGKPINIPRIMLQSLDFICFHTTTRVKDKRERRLVKIVEMIDIDPRTKELITNEVFSWDSINDTFKYSGRSYLLEEIRVETNMSKYEIQQELNNRVKIINWMVKNNLNSIRDVVQILNEYKDNPEEILKRVESNA